MTAVADAHIREQALDVTQSFVVTAPAGSGKTELLTRRFLKLLAICEQPEAVLCITFTRKAAEEMRTRIVQALERGLDPEPEESAARESWHLAQGAISNMTQRQWQLLQNTNRLQVMTIDSLCRKLAQHLPFESGLGVLPGTLDNADILYQQAARNTLAQLETDANLRPALSDFLLHLDNNFAQAEKLIAELLQKREQWLPHLLAAHGERDALEHNIELLILPTLQKAHEQLRPYTKTLPAFARFAADNMRDKPGHFIHALTDITELPACTTASLPQWQAIAQLLLTEKNEWRKSGGINAKLGFPTDKTSPVAQEKKAGFIALVETLSEHDALRQQLAVIRQLPDAEYDDKRWLALQHATAVMMRAVAELKLLFATNQQSDFTEITLAALQALGDDEAPTDLALRLDYRIQHILVDEFQDTAKPQYDLLSKLTRGWQPDDGRTLFLVGDAMQSCYGFREANVGLFMKARQQGIGNIALHDVQLSVNFRSQHKIVQWVNDSFAAAFPSQEDFNTGATRYCEATAFKPALEDEAVYCHGFVGDDGSAQAEKIAELIASIRAQHPDDSIAVLVRSRTPLQSILPVLRAHGIDWQATDIEPLAGQMPVLDLLSLTRALLSPADEMAWMAVLRTPWLGLCNADLLALAQHRKQQAQTLWQSLAQWQTVKNLSADSQKILQRAMPTLQLCMAQTHRKSLRTHVQGCWQALGGLLTLRSANEHEQCLHFLDLLEKHERGGTITDMPQFERALDKLYANAPASSGNPVQIMTMHKSKGLQFDHVLLPQLGKHSRGNDTPLLLWHEYLSELDSTNTNTGHDQVNLLLDILPEAGRDKSGTLYDYLGKLKKLKEQHETLRVLYVACTRAIKHLHLLASVSPPNNDGDEYKPPANTMLAAIWPAFSNAATSWTVCASTTNDDNDTETADTESADIVLTYLQRLPATFSLPITGTETLLHPWRGHEYANHNDPGNQPAVVTEEQRAAQVSGILLHRLLRCIGEDGVVAWPDKRIESLQGRWQQQLQSEGLLPVQAATQSARLAAALQNTLKDPRGLWILDQQHQGAHCEWALADGQQTHIIDRCFIDNGVRWIIDYKSAEPQPGESTDTFLRDQLEQYREQLQRYQNLCLQLDAIPVQCALYFPLTGGWISL